jgi:hypothetical protein
VDTAVLRQLDAVFGLLLIAAGESIGVLFAIQDDTHAAAEHLYKVVSEKNTPKDLSQSITPTAS